MAGIGVSFAALPASAAGVVNYAYAVSSLSLITETLFHAEKAGITAREGVVTKIIWLQGDSLGVKAVLSGDVDVAWVGTTVAFQAIARGAKIKIVYSPVPKSSNVILANQKIKTVADLKGGSIAVSSIGAISYDIPRLILQRNHVDPASASYVALGSTATRYQALVAEKVDAGMVDLVQGAEASVRYPYLHVVASAAEQIPDLHFISMIATDRYVAENHDTLVHLVRAQVGGAKFEIEHPDEAAELSLSRIAVSDKKILADGFREAARLHIFGLDGGLGRGPLESTLAIMRELHELDGDVDLDKALAPEIVRDAHLDTL